MKAKVDSVLKQRAGLLRQMGAIGSLRRGSLSRQFFVRRQGGESRSLGPYFVLQGYFRGKKFSERIPASRARLVRQQVRNHRRFQSLAEEFASLTEQLTRLELEPLNHYDEL